MEDQHQGCKSRLSHPGPRLPPTEEQSGSLASLPQTVTELEIFAQGLRLVHLSIQSWKRIRV